MKLENDKIKYVHSLYSMAFDSLHWLCPAPRRDVVAVVKLDAIGDYVLFRPFLARLRTSELFRRTKLVLIGNEAWKDLALALDDGVVDEFVFVNWWDFVLAPAYRLRTIRRVKKLGADTVVNATLSRGVAIDDALVRVSSARVRIGGVADAADTHPTLRRIADRYYTRIVPASGGSTFEFREYQAFFSQLGCDVGDLKPHLDASRLKPHSPPIASPYAILFPGGSWPGKRWEASKFAEIGKYLVDTYKLIPVLCGSQDDKPAADLIRSTYPSLPWLDLTGATSLLDLTALTAGAEIIVANDTSIVHIAAALHRRCVCLVGGGQFGKFAPYPPELSERIVTVYHRMDCFGCYWNCSRRTGDGDPVPCVRGISVAAVREAVDKALKLKG